MKWAYLKMPNLCLPKANAEGRRTKSFALFDKAKPIERWERNGMGFVGMGCFSFSVLAKLPNILGEN